MLTRPASDEFFEYYGRYIDQVPERDVLGILDEQRATMRETLGHLPPDRAGYRYAPEKWTIADVIQHLSDAERIFAYRALRIARGDETPLPSWDENAYAARRSVRNRARMMQPPRQMPATTERSMSQPYSGDAAAICSKPCAYATIFEA